MTRQKHTVVELENNYVPFDMDFERYNLKTQQATYYVKDVYDSAQVYLIEF